MFVALPSASAIRGCVGLVRVPQAGTGSKRLQLALGQNKVTIC